MEKYFLEENEKEKLLAFCGYGHYPTAQIAFLGNEEGLAGYELPFGIKARCASFGLNPDTYIGSSWRNGYYEMGEIVDPLFEKEMLRLRGSLRPPGKLKSPMLEFQARMMLFMEHGFTGDWFKKSTEDPHSYVLITDYYRNIGRYESSGLYKRSAKIGSALLDLRPFPRRDEGKAGNKWPYANINEKQYNKAFSFQDLPGITEEYKQLRDIRAQYLMNAITTYRFPIIIGIGDKESKRHFFERYFDAEFKPDKMMSLTKNKLEVFISEPVNDWGMIVVLSDFFDHGFKGIGLNGLRILTTQIITPLIKEKLIPPQP